MAEQDWRVKTALLKHRVSKFNPNHDPDTGRFSSGPGGGGGAAPKGGGGSKSPKRRTLAEIVTSDPRPTSPEWDGSDAQKEFVVEYKRVNAEAAKDPRVKAVRADKLVGEGSEKGRLSFTYNTFTDAELVEFLDRSGATTPAKAIKEMRIFEEIKMDQYEDMKGMMDW
tara:strand:- start:42 stop:545 length:504 start_codon:yes stop_codon:yes gene_type:complete